METRRFILALAMSLLVFLVYVRFFAPAPPQQPVQEPVREAPREDARSVAPSFPEPDRMTFRPPSMDVTSERVRSSMFICRPTSTSLGDIIHMEQSFVGKVLSS